MGFWINHDGPVLVKTGCNGFGKCRHLMEIRGYDQRAHGHHLANDGHTQIGRCGQGVHPMRASDDHRHKHVANGLRMVAIEDDAGMTKRGQHVAIFDPDTAPQSPVTPANKLKEPVNHTRQHPIAGIGVHPFEIGSQFLMLLLIGHKVISVTAIISGLMRCCLIQGNSPPCDGFEKRDSSG